MEQGCIHQENLIGAGVRDASHNCGWLELKRRVSILYDDQWILNEQIPQLHNSAGSSSDGGEVHGPAPRLEAMPHYVLLRGFLPRAETWTLLVLLRYMNKFLPFDVRCTPRCLWYVKYDGAGMHVGDRYCCRWIDLKVIEYVVA